ncbi:MAG: YcxB family protein [Gemmiger sp.]
MSESTIQIPVRLSSVAFQEFALFDILSLRKRWRRPLLFAVLMAAFACVCFVVGRANGQGVLLGWVLLVIGLGIPVVYFLYFFHSVKQQAEKMKLDTPRLVYTVELNANGAICRPIGSHPQVETTPWAEMYGAWRREDVIYLYVRPGRAYILPGKQANVSDDKLWAYLTGHLPAGKCHAKR